MVKVVLIQDNGGSIRCYGPFENYEAFRVYSEARNLRSKPSLMPGDFILQEVHPLGPVKSEKVKENKKYNKIVRDYYTLKKDVEVGTEETIRNLRKMLDESRTKLRKTQAALRSYL